MTLFYETINYNWSTRNRLIERKMYDCLWVNDREIALRNLSSELEE